MSTDETVITEVDPTGDEIIFYPVMLTAEEIKVVSELRTKKALQSAWLQRYLPEGYPFVAGDDSGR